MTDVDDTLKGVGIGAVQVRWRASLVGISMRTPEGEYEIVMLPSQAEDIADDLKVAARKAAEMEP